MRETDSRMAKYSRRGLLFNFCAYLVCLVEGKFVEENRELTILLTGGFLIVTVLRGFFLFRFDQQYPRAPMKWRNRYFIATLLGAVWWGLIMSCITYELEMEYEAPLLWLYTIVFFSTTAHAFAPFQRFLTAYQFIGLVPAALTAFFVGGFTGAIYGLLMLMFFFVLTHQCRLISENYWEKLEATYALARKTQSLEEEKRDTRASVQLNKEFLGYLCSDLDKAIHNQTAAPDGVVVAPPTPAMEKQSRALEKIYHNVSQFNDVLNKEMSLSNKIFNIRHELQHIIGEFIDENKDENVNIESALSPTLPMRLKGDASRLAQVLRTLLSLCLKELGNGLVLIEVEFIREYETAGEMYVNISRVCATNKKRFFDEGESHLAQASLSFALAKGIAELMGGGIEVVEIPQEGQQIRFNARLEIAEFAGQLDFHRNSFAGKTALLVNDNPRIVDVKRRELEALGFDVITETQYKRAMNVLISSFKSSKPIEVVLYYVGDNHKETVEFNNNLIEHSELRYTHQFIAVSRERQRNLHEKGYFKSDNVHFIDRPLGLFELESAFDSVFLKGEKEDNELPTHSAMKKAVKVTLYSTRDNAKMHVRQKVGSWNSDIAVVSSLKELNSSLKYEIPDVILIDCDDDTDIVEVVDMVRNYENELIVDVFVPILGITRGDGGSANDSSLRSHAYELGLDEFIDLSNTNKNLKEIIKYWAGLQLQ